MTCVGYILGAGFSQAFGIPPTDTLLEKILGFRYRGWTTIRILQWQDHIWKYLKVNYSGCSPESQLPHVVQLMNHIYLSDELRTIFGDMDKRATFAYEEYWTTFTALMSSYFFLETLRLNDIAWERIHLFVKQLNSTDIIITLNWDTLLEHAFVDRGGVDIKEKELPFVIGKKIDGKISIYKLHGSIDFMGVPNDWMKKYWKEFQSIELGQAEPMWRVKTYDRERVWKPEMPWELANKASLLLAPPAGIHHLRYPFVKQMWRNAFDHLKECTEFVVIGYSLPRDDYFIQMMLSGLYSKYHKSKGTKVRVMDPDPTGKVEQRWKLLLGEEAVDMIRTPFEQSIYVGQ